MNQALKYPLNIQLFAEGNEGNPEDGATEGKPTETTPPPQEDKKFTQKEVDEMIAKRLAREGKKKTAEKTPEKPPKDGEGNEDIDKPDDNLEANKSVEADIKLQLANQRLVSASAMAEAIKLNIIPEHIQDVIELAKLTGDEMNADGSIDIGKIATKLGEVIKRMPMLVKPKEEANNGFRIGGQNNKPDSTNGWNNNKTQPANKKPWNKFQ